MEQDINIFDAYQGVFKVPSNRELSRDEALEQLQEFYEHPLPEDDLRGAMMSEYGCTFAGLPEDVQKDVLYWERFMDDFYGPNGEVAAQINRYYDTKDIEKEQLSTDSSENKPHPDTARKKMPGWMQRLTGRVSQKQAPVKGDKSPDHERE